MGFLFLSRMRGRYFYIYFMKICNKCNLSKDFEFFYKRHTNKDGYRNTCKECELDSKRKSNQKYYEKNKEILNEKNILFSKKWRKENVDKTKLYSKNYRLDNKDNIKLYSKNYHEENKSKINSYKNKNKKERIKSDYLFRLKCNIRSSISNNLKSQGYTKKNNTTDIICISFEDFRIYLESKFEYWMNWENYGRYNGDFEYGWDIDHIIPISSAITENDVIKLNHYTNLQPLCSKVNRDIKRDNIKKE